MNKFVSYMKWSKKLSFSLMGLLVLFMVAATLLEKRYGTDFAIRHLYTSPYFMAGWGGLALSSLVYLFLRKVHKQPATFLLHLSFMVILAGALVTHVWGIQGSVHLRQDSPTAVSAFAGDDGTRMPFPFMLSLKDFSLEYYPGTSAPMDFVSRLLIKDGETTSEGKVSMNHIYSYRHYRFYQSRYDSDGKGTTLAVAYDPWGIAITYMGYGLLLFSMLLFFSGKQSRFRRLLRSPLLKPTATGILLLVAISVQAQERPRTLPRETAAKFGDLYIYYNDRVCPLQTLARDFTVKLYGKPSYRGMTAEQVLTGWFFYYDTWKKEPCIRIKSKETARTLGIKGKYACLEDFADANGYKLDKTTEAYAEVQDKRGWEETNEKFSLISMVVTGSIWKIVPFASAENMENECLHWYSLADRLPTDMPDELESFVRGSMNYIGEQVARNDFQQVNRTISKIRQYQMREGGEMLPSDFRFRAEKCYNRLNNSFPLAIICVLSGLLTFALYCRCLVTRKAMPVRATKGFLALLATLFLYLGFTLALRGLAGGYIPLSNGHETMQLLAACTALLPLFLYRKAPMVISFGFLLCGLSLMVSMMGESNPQVTQLMPVLQSPLLSFHVVVIMAAYSLLAFIMLNGVTVLILRCFHKTCDTEVERLQLISSLLLYPAVFLLATGIFIGAVWANVSWGRYWGWDPKEVWALITLMVYAFPLHPHSLPWFNRPLFFHLYSVVAFFSVLFTYFGVNFLLGGMHSYA